MIVIGAGVCGMQAAFRAVYRDQRVAIVEKERLGGTCLTRGCIPTKAMVRSAEVAHLARRGEEFGVEITGQVQPDLERVVERKDEIVDRVEETNERDIEATDELDLYRATARFVDEHTIEVDGEQLRGERFVIATGARPMVPDWPGMDETDALTSRSFLEMTDKPEHLIVVGGGYIGIECGQVAARLGSDVTILQRSVLLKQEDQQLVDIIRGALEADGIDLREGTSVTRVSQAGETIQVTTEDEAGKQATVEGDELLVAIGRVPNSDSLDLEAAGVETYGPGWIETDEHMRTSQPHIYAVGDAVGHHLFTHVGREEAAVAIEHMLDGKDDPMDYHAAPYAVFSDPELARVGYTLEEAEAAGYDAEEIEFTYEHLGKALCLGEEEGMMKVVADAETGELLGFHIVAHHGAELLPEAVLQMHKRGTVDDLADAIHIHPTMAEGVNDAAYTMAIELGRRRF